MAKVVIEYEAQAASLKAAVSEVTAANDELSASALASSKKVTEAYKQQGAAAAAAFGSQQTKAALDAQVAGSDALAKNLKKLYDEEVRLLAEGKQMTAEFKRNRDEADKLRGKIQEAYKATEQLGNATEKTTSRSKSLTGQLRQMKAELAALEQAGKDGTKEFEKLAIAAGKLEDQIGDTRERVKVLSSDTFVFDAAIDSVNALAGSFAAVQGAVGLFAEDSQELQEAIAKTNSALAILNGLQQVQAFLTGQSAGKLAVLSAAQKVYNFVVEGSTVATKAWRAVLVASGIGAVVAIIATLASKFGETKKATDEAAESARNYQKAIDGLSQSLQTSQTKAANAQIQLLQKQGKLTEEQANRLIIQNNLQSQVTQANIKAKEAETEALKRFEEQKAEDVKNNGELIKTTQEQLFNDLKAIETQRQVEIKDATIASRLAIAEFEDKKRKEAEDKNKKAAEARLELEKQRRAALLKFAQELNDIEAAFNKERDERIKKSLASYQDLIKASSFEDTTLGTQLNTRINFVKQLEIIEGSSVERRVNLIELEGQARKAATFDQIADTKERASAIELIEAETQQKIRDEYAKTRKEQIDNAIQIVQAYVGVFQELNNLSKQLRENRIADIKEASDFELEAINNSTATERQKQRQREALALRTNRLIRAEEIKQARADKAIAIFTAAINTAVAVTKVIANPILAAAVGIAGAAQVAAIAAKPIPKFAKGGQVGGKLHSEGGTLIEAERGEYIINRRQTARHRPEIEAMNRSSAAFKKLIEQKYVRPALMQLVNDSRNNAPVVVNATLNSRTMEAEIRGLRKDMKRKGYGNILHDTRYQWHSR